MYWQLFRVFIVMALVIYAGVLSTPKGKLPLALRGLKKMLKKDGYDVGAEAITPVSAKRKLAAFAIVLLAAVIALLR